MSTERYSLSSATTSGPCKQKKKRVSGLISLKSTRSSQEYIRRGDDALQATHDDARSSMSKAAAWVWHTRGIGEAAVLPTKRVMQTRLRHDHNLQTTVEALEMMRRRPPLPAMSRFKAEAMLLSGNHLPLAEQDSPAAAADHPKIEQRHSCTANKRTFFYDDLELSSLQELLDRKMVSPGAAAPDHHHHDSNKPLKPFSAISRLFKRLFKGSTSVQPIPAQITPYSKSNGTDKSPFTSSTRGNSAVLHHVIHHHHHHYHHQRSHSESSYVHHHSKAQNFNSSSSCEENPNPSSAIIGREWADSIDVASGDGFEIPSTEDDDNDSDDEGAVPSSPVILVGSGPIKLASRDHHYRRPRRHSYCVDSTPAAALPLR